MPELFKNLLSLHIMLGVIATAVFGYIWLQLRNPEYKLKNIKLYSVAGIFSLFASWVTGGYYYLYYYGSKVKPVILSGNWPWAHKLIMEAKEHIFLIMPFLGLVVLAIVFGLGEQLKNDLKLKKYLEIVSFLTAGIGAIMIIMGFIISNAY